MRNSRKVSRIDIAAIRRDLEREEIARRVPEDRPSREERIRVAARRKLLKEQLRVLTVGKLK